MHEGEGTDDGFGGACGGEGVAGDGFGGGDGDFSGMGTEAGFDGADFGEVADRVGGSVAIDVVDGIGVEPGFAEGFFDGADYSLAVGFWGHGVESFAASAVAEEFGIDSGVATEGVAEFFEDDIGGAFAHDKAVALAIERFHGFGGGTGPASHGVAHGKAVVDGIDEGGFGATGDHDIDIFVLDHAHGVAHDIATGGAAGATGDGVAFAADFCGDFGATASDIAIDHHGGGDRAVAALVYGAAAFVSGIVVTEGGGFDHPDAVGIDFGEIDVGVGDGELGGGEAVLGGAVQAAGEFGFDEIEGVPVGDFGGESGRGITGMKAGERGDGAAAFGEIFPEDGESVASGGDEAHSCDNDPPIF